MTEGQFQPEGHPAHPLLGADPSSPVDTPPPLLEADPLPPGDRSPRRNMGPPRK